jgi:hypothetical protein
MKSIFSGWSHRALVTAVVCLLASLGCSASDLTSPSTDGKGVATIVSPRGVVTSSSITAGWTSTTGFRRATTAVQVEIVRVANRATGNAPASRVGSPYTSSVPWLTDVSPDGFRMRAAIKRFHAWYHESTRTRVSLSTIKSRMIADLSGSEYSSASKATLVDWLVNRYTYYAASGTYAIPSTDQATLDYIFARAMCLEWAVTVALQSGGRPNGYSFPGLTDFSKARPGMALYMRDRSHAMLIRDIYWDSQGNPTKFIVAESNWGSGWTNPKGMIPWKRTLKNSRVVTFNASTMKIVDYEAR